MDLFLSWSTPRSEKLGRIFYDWISNVLPTLDIFYSPENIDAGQKWQEVIGDGLADNSVGIFFLVEENLTSQWLNFEAGALASKVDDPRVIPALHDLRPEQISGPMTQYQAKILSNKDDVFRIVKTINNSLKDSRKIESQKLESIFEKWYPDFENEYKNFASENPRPTESDFKDKSPVLDQEGQIGEILNIVRQLNRSHPKSTSRPKITLIQDDVLTPFKTYDVEVYFKEMSIDKLLDLSDLFIKGIKKVESTDVSDGVIRLSLDNANISTANGVRSAVIKILKDKIDMENFSIGVVER